ncbi:hypothetical protein BDK51DRAFT_39594 [Blyttiomyces helicus]|uniref:Uncharacterized protein n=1 Tax=Blyttiomyces helicus TaxID=388810 RepID=A0A4P9WMW9_9FUNG|nr:hypothetical protein BDK51DRAFT_39594 [Blyttiomyces helicus]|eukprot:RKO93383.1 hypothetical protein BDK51DRAFT_39594 [Blyttiomyces helicus]
MSFFSQSDDDEETRRGVFALKANAMPKNDPTAPRRSSKAPTPPPSSTPLDHFVEKLQDFSRPERKPALAVVTETNGANLPGPTSAPLPATTLTAPTSTTPTGPTGPRTSSPPGFVPSRPALAAFGSARRPQTMSHRKQKPHSSLSSLFAPLTGGRAAGASDGSSIGGRRTSADTLLLSPEGGSSEGGGVAMERANSVASVASTDLLFLSIPTRAAGDDPGAESAALSPGNGASRFAYGSEDEHSDGRAASPSPRKEAEEPVSGGEGQTPPPVVAPVATKKGAGFWPTAYLQASFQAVKDSVIGEGKAVADGEEQIDWGRFCEGSFGRDRGGSILISSLSSPFTLTPLSPVQKKANEQIQAVDPTPYLVRP